jgi:hypothetical protein
MDGEKLIRASDARKAILNIDPKSAYCIDSIQIVNAVEVVRCKNCIHWKDLEHKTTEHEKLCDIGFYMVGENGFCCFGNKNEGK